MLEERYSQLKEKFLAVKSRRETDKRLIPLRDSAQRLIGGVLARERVFSKEEKNSIQACFYAFDLLQEDAVVEFIWAVKEDYQTDTFSPKLSIGDAIEIIIGGPPKAWNTNLQERQIAFLLMSNIFNRADVLVETAITATKSNQDEAVGGVFLEKVLAKARLSSFKNTEGEETRANFQEMIDHVKNLCRIWEIDTSSWDGYIEKIVAAQARGMSLVVQSRREGKIAYSVEQALDYRRQTIGNYARLLADIAFIDPEQKSKFIEKMMKKQIKDDKQDIRQDLDTQVNPFVGLIAKHDLVTLLRRESDVLDLSQFLLEIPGLRRDLQRRKEAKSIEREYLNI